MAVCILLTVAAAAYASTLGSYPIGFFESFQVMFDHITGNITDDMKDHIIFNIRLPRILTAIVAGASLAIAGATMQSIMKNPLADPYTTGISSGASFGASLAIILGFSLFSNDDYGIILNAFVFSLIPAFAMIALSSFNRTSPATMILTGIAVMYLFNALTTLIKLGASDESLAALFNWTVGDLAKSSWDSVRVILAVTVCCFVAIMFTHKKMNILTMGDRNAIGMGIDAHKLRIVLLLILSLMTASVVCYTGIIGFIGLVAPHMVRMFMGSDNKYLIPASAIFGALLLLVADVIARTIIAPVFLPVGVITAFIGCPMFIYLLVKRRRTVW